MTPSSIIFRILPFVASTCLMAGTQEQKQITYMQKGYLLPDVRGDTVIPGQIFHIKDIIIKCEQNIDLSPLSLPVFSGARASQKTVESLQSALSEFFLNNGFPFAKIITRMIPAKQHANKIQLEFELFPGAGYKLGTLQFQKTKTKHRVLHRMSLLSLGETLNNSRLEKSRRKLAQSGYFAHVVQSGFYRDSVRHVLYPVFHIEDIPGYRINGLFGYASEASEGNRLSGRLDIILKNIMGTARDFEFRFSGEKSYKEISLQLKEPWIASLPVGAKAGFHIILEDSVYNEFLWRVAFFQDINFYSHYALSFQLQKNEIFSFNQSDTLVSKSSHAYMTGLDVRLDWRNTAPYTTKGMLINLGVQAIRRQIQDSSAYLLGTTQDSDYWLPFAKRFIFHHKWSSRTIWPLSASIGNRGDLFYIGGAQTVRGYFENSFLTNFSIYNNFEIQYLLSAKNRILLFADPAFINRLKGTVHWRKKIGYGIWAELGNNSWVFGLGYALNPERQIMDGLIHANIQNHF